MNTAHPPVAAATSVRSPRSLAPDLARGFMLLLIALAYGALYVPGGFTAVVLSPDGSVIEQVVNFLRITFVNERAYTMFAALFGYGIVMSTGKLVRNGFDQRAMRKFVRRRGWLLLLFGFVHGALVYSGEILGTYGLVSVLLAGLMVASDRSLKRATVIFLVIQGLLLAWLWVGAYATGALPDDSVGLAVSYSYLESVVARAVEYPFSPLYVIVMYPVIPVMLIGVWAGRNRLLQDVESHGTLLRWMAVVGIAMSVAGGAPFGLIGAEWWVADPIATGIAAAAHNLTGIAGGLGYLALFGLIGARWQERPGVVADALAAAGQRSLTCYLLMSALVAGTLAPWGLDIGQGLSVVGAAVAAFLCWAAAVVICVALDRFGLPGPADALLRRMLYRKSGARS